MMRHRSVIVVLALSSLLLASGCIVKPRDEERKPVRVGVMQAAQGTASSQRTYVGTVEEASTTAVAFSLGGRVTAVHVRNGQHVVAGQRLVDIDNSDALNACEAARATLEEAKDGYRRAKVVYEKGTLPEIKWVEVQTRLNQAQSVYDIACRRLDDCSLQAPVSGIVQQVAIEPGTYVAPGVPILSIVDLSNLYVRISVPEIDVNRVAIGSMVSVDIGALPDSLGFGLTGIVTERNVTPDPIAHSYSLRVRLQRPPHGLLPGMVGTCHLSSANQSRGMELPARAIQLTTDGSRFVWIVKQGRAVQAPVTIGDLTTSGVLVTSGISPDDTVIVDGTLKVSKDTEVEPVPIH